MNDIEVDTFESELGDVAVTSSHIERTERVSEEFEELEEILGTEEVLDKVHLSEVEDIDADFDAVYPFVAVKIDGDWKKLFFKTEELAENVYKAVNYRWRSYREIYD